MTELSAAALRRLPRPYNRDTPEEWEDRVAALAPIGLKPLAFCGNCDDYLPHGIEHCRWRLRPNKRKKLAQRLRETIFARDGRQCRQCGSRQNLEVDHVHPVVYGGAQRDLENLQTLCSTCNGRKGSRLDAAHPNAQARPQDAPEDRAAQ